MGLIICFREKDRSKEREEAWMKVAVLAKDSPYYPQVSQVGDSIWVLHNILQQHNETDNSDILGLEARKHQDTNHDA